MSSFLSHSTRRTLIITFCLWHMAAVGVYALPDTLESALHVQSIIEPIRRTTRPYTLILSQWQKWPLFAPDPLRRVISFSIEADRGHGWAVVRESSAESLPWWIFSEELKTIRRLEEEDRDQPLRERYAQLVCSPLALPGGTPVRLRRDSYIIPREAALSTLRMWQQWKPTWYSDVMAETTCPPLY